MFDKAKEISELLRSALISFRDTNLSQVSYLSLGLALGAGLFLLLAVIFKLCYGNNRSQRPYSGHDIPEDYLRGNTAKYIYLLPKFMSVVSIIFMLLALANPYLPRTIIEEHIESIEWIHLIDASPSKGWEFEHSGKSTAEVTHDSFMRFLAMRKGQNDRCSLWIFSAAPSMLEDFITDEDVYYMQAEDMPYIITDPGSAFFPKNDPNNDQLDIVVPLERIRLVMNGGGTNLVAGLEAAIKHFDRSGDKNIKTKVLLIETDMAIDADPQVQLRELKRRNIHVYVLHTEPNRRGEMLAKGTDTKLINAGIFRALIEKYGFKMFSVHDPKSLDNAYRDVNRLHRSPGKITRHLLKVFIYQRFLIIAIVTLFIILVKGILIEKPLGQDP